MWSFTFMVIKVNCSWVHYKSDCWKRNRPERKLIAHCKCNVIKAILKNVVSSSVEFHSTWCCCYCVWNMTWHPSFRDILIVRDHPGKRNQGSWSLEAILWRLSTEAGGVLSLEGGTLAVFKCLKRSSLHLGGCRRPNQEQRWKCQGHWAQLNTKTFDLIIIISAQQ